MKLKIEIPDQVGRVMQQRAEAAGTDLASLVRQVVVENANGGEAYSPRSRSVEEFIQRQNAWVKLHPRHDHPINDSRESIYAGRE